MAFLVGIDPWYFLYLPMVFPFGCFDLRYFPMVFLSSPSIKRGGGMRASQGKIGSILCDIFEGSREFSREDFE